MARSVFNLAFLLSLLAMAAPCAATTFVVTNTNDAGAGSLRQAMTDANGLAGADTIVFQSGVSGTIQLQSALPLISTDMQIIGPGAGVLTVRRQVLAEFRIFFVGSATATISGLTIANGNTVSAGSAGIGAQGSVALTLSGCVITGNTGNSAGGLYASAGYVTIDDCTFSNNLASGTGGLEVIASFGVSITNTTVSGNSGACGGLKVYGNGAPVRVTNCTISGNTSPSPGNTGGVECFINGTSADVILTNCTITANSAALSGAAIGGGLNNRNSTTLFAQILNCLIAGNMESTQRSDIGGSLQSLGYNLIGDITGGSIAAQAGDQFGTGASPVNPLLGPLASNGGNTQTHALLAGSPAINTGTSVGAPAADQRGQARIGQTDKGAYEYVPTTPDCQVTRGATPVADNSADNLSGGFGAAVPTNITYTFTNSGGGTLTLTNPATLGGFNNCSVSIVTPPATSLTAFQTTDTVLAVTPTGAGAFSFTYSIANNDAGAGKNPYNWTVNGTATAPQPELDVFRGAAPIASGGSDGVGTSFSAGFGTPVTYTFNNTGTAALTLTNPATIGSQSNCAVAITTPPATSVSAGNSTTTTLTITPAGAGAFSFTYSIANNDASENPYTWSVNGTAGAAAPELDVFRGASAVPSGGSDALTGSFTAATPFNITYTMQNNGTASLTITNPATISNLINCTVNVTAAPGSPVAALASTQTTLQVTPAAAGPFSFSYSLANSDTDENPYAFQVGGTAGVGGVPEMDISRSSAPIADGNVDSVGNLPAGVAAPLVYTISNSGGVTLSLTGSPIVQVSGASNCSVSVTAQPAAPTVAASGNSVFTVQVTPTAAGAFVFTLTIANDDANENPYDWVVVGTGTTAGGGGGGGGGGGDEEGCSASETSGSLLLLSAVLCLLLVGVKIKARRVES